MDERTLEIIKLILQVIIALGALGAAFFGWASKRAIQQVHIQLNSRMTEMMALQGSSSRAEGRDSMRKDVYTLGDVGPAGPAGEAGIQGPIGPQGQVGPRGTSE